MAAGEIHGVLGENGAGKTTLARILGGLIAADEGRVEVAGRATALKSARDARALGVAMVHQHFSLVDSFTGFDNVALFNPGAWARTGRARAGYRDKVERRARELRLDVALDVPVGALGVGDRQRVEILKALMSETRVLLLDEPTAVLAPAEVEGLFSVLNAVAASGTAVALVAHKLDEVLSVTQRVTVLRRGKRVLTGDTEALSAQRLARAMVGAAWSEASSRTMRGRGREGGESAQERARRRPEPLRARDEADGESKQRTARYATVAALEGVGVRSRDRALLVDVSLAVERGEVVGVAGVDGNGQRTLAAVLAGVLAPDSGTATLPARVGWIPQDRDREGLVGAFTIVENVALALHADADRRRGPWLDWAALERSASDVLDALNVRCPSPRATARSLSGGNRQRVVVGREFLRASDLLVAEQPTRGLDIKATRTVRDRIARLARPPDDADRPPGVVLISADLDEILELADRICVMVRGRLVSLDADERSAAAIGARMLAAAPDS